MGLPTAKESRVLCNFDGSLDQVSTIAHELGHAYHNECVYQAGKTMIQQDKPMTLAETASIMSETIVMEAVLSQTTDPQERLAIIETQLIGDTQVIVDIFSRYLFEKEVFERREKSELSAADLCAIMEQAQKTVYGDGLDDRFLHKYMWTWKPHYYYPGLPFYNFPYAFGLLFGTRFVCHLPATRRRLHTGLQEPARFHRRSLRRRPGSPFRDGYPLARLLGEQPGCDCRADR